MRNDPRGNAESVSGRYLFRANQLFKLGSDTWRGTDIGRRLSLSVIGEEADPEQIKAIRRRNIPTISEEEGKYLVQFHIEGVRPLIGNE